jgi:hypothetical protein
MTLWEAMNSTEQVDTIQNMRQYGGHFAGYIGSALMHADSQNRRRLTEAFPDLIERYQPKNWSRECADAL